jgi:hypothetical protein
LAKLPAGLGNRTGRAVWINGAPRVVDYLLLLPPSLSEALLSLSVRLCGTK